MNPRLSVRRATVGPLALGLAGLVASLWVSVATPASALSASGSLKLGPTAPLAGQHITAHGRLSSHRSRPVVLQLLRKSSWTTVAEGKTSVTGTYRLTSRVGATTGVSTYRVRALAFTQHGHRHPAVVTPRASVTAVDQTADLWVQPTDTVRSPATTWRPSPGSARARGSSRASDPPILEHGRIRHRGSGWRCDSALQARFSRVLLVAGSGGRKPGGAFCQQRGVCGGGQ